MEQWKILQKSCPVVDSTALSCLIVKTICEVVHDAENFYLSIFKGRDCWVKKFFWQIYVNILMPTTFFHGEPGYSLFCTVAVPKLDSVVGREACLKTAFS